MTSAELLCELSKRYPTDRGEYAFFANVRNGVGFQRAVRTADAVVMSMWPSRGISLDGFELKVSRGDWQAELKNNAKADAIAKYCDAWWVVAPTGVVKIGELPPTWGLLEWNGKWKVRYAQRPLTAQPLDRLMVASLIRAFNKDMVPTALIDSMVKEKLEMAVENRAREYSHELAQCKRSLKEIDAFEEASGIQVRNGWSGKSIGEAVKIVLRGDHKIIPQSMRLLLGEIELLRATVSRMIDTVGHDGREDSKQA